MKDMEAKLGPKIFARIHRSPIVNSDRIKEIKPWCRGEYIVITREGRSSRRSGCSAIG
jgi:two-component system LytT family response regulator